MNGSSWVIQSFPRQNKGPCRQLSGMVMMITMVMRMMIMIGMVMLMMMVVIVVVYHPKLAECPTNDDLPIIFHPRLMAHPWEFRFFGSQVFPGGQRKPASSQEGVDGLSGR